MKVYLLYEQEDTGPKGLMATLDPSKLHGLLDTFTGWGAVPVKELHTALDAALAAGGGNLHGEHYGGIVLEIADLA